MPHTLLLADDSVTIQRVIELTFADEDVRVVAVSNGDEAIAVLNRNPPDIVLADVGMPGPSGYDIAQYIKDTPQLAHIPVVLLTGAFEPVDQAKAAAVGCDGVLAKPFEPQLVIGRVKDLLARRHQASPSAPVAQSLTPASSVLETLSIEPPADPTRVPLPADLGDYFDRLDQAFANFADPETMNAAPPVDADADWLGLKNTTLDAPASWALPPLEDLPDLPLSFGSVATDAEQVDRLDPSPFLAPEPPVSQPSGEAVPSSGEVSESSFGEPSPPLAQAPPPSGGASPPFDETSQPSGDAAPAPEIAPVPALPSLADAFAALLAAERSGPAPSAAAWPSGPAPASDVPDLVEQVTRSVLERLSDSVVRDTVRDTVTGVAERLVREEIERIKSNIK